MNLRQLLYLVLLLCVGFNSLAQIRDIKYGITFGNSIHSLVHYSKYDYSMNDGKSDSKFLEKLYFSSGINIGVQCKKAFTEKRIFYSDLTFFKRNNVGEKIEYTNSSGNPLGSQNQLISNYSLQWNNILTYKVKQNPVIGGGFYVDWLISSKTKIKNPETNEKIKVKNGYYNPITAGLVLMVGIQKEHTLVSLQIKEGITDKIRGRDNYIKEYDLSLQVNYTYFF
jgi:hypothetical protein